VQETEHPSIGDIAFSVPLLLLDLLYQDLASILHPALPVYLTAVRTASKKFQLYMQHPAVMLTGFHLWLRTPAAFQILALPRDCTFKQLLEIAVRISGLQIQDTAVRFGGSIPGQQPTNLTGYPDCPVLDDQTSLLTIGFGPKRWTSLVVLKSQGMRSVGRTHHI
jgi:hypothetical protein